MAEDVQKVNVEVNGGYNPGEVNLKQGVPAQITFNRTNSKGCLDVVHSKDLNFEKELPINEPQTVNITTDKAGEYQFSCGMDMFSGKIIIQ